MKIAIPADGKKVSAHFGHCAQFIIYDIDKDQKKIKSKKAVDNPGHEPGVLPGFLADLGVNCIIAGGMGSRAKRLFDQNNIQTLAGIEGDSDKAIEDYLEGKLESKGNYCDH